MSTLVLVCGSREWRPKDYRDVFDRILKLRYEQPDAKVIHGDARGIDRFAGACAEAFGLSVTPIRAEWAKYGKGAGPVRNRRMLDLQPDLVLAFWDGVSSGTKGAIDEAKRRGIPVEVLP